MAQLSSWGHHHVLLTLRFAGASAPPVPLLAPPGYGASHKGLMGVFLSSERTVGPLWAQLRGYRSKLLVEAKQLRDEAEITCFGCVSTC